MLNQLSSKNVLLLVTGTEEPLAAAVITTANDIFINPKMDSKEYKDAGLGAGSTKTYVNTDLTTVDFTVDVTARSAAGAGEVPKYADLFKICGMSEDIVADTSVTYKPTLPGTRGTSKAFLDGEVRTISGISGAFSLSGTIGEFAKLSFKLQGFTDAEPIAEANPNVSLDNNEKLIVQQATLITENGNDIDLESFDIDTGMEVEQVYGVSSKFFYIKDFKPTLKIKAIKTKGNSIHWTDLKNNAIKTIKIVLGSNVGKQMEIKADFCNPSDVSESDDKGIVVFEKSYLCQSSVGGDNFSIKYF